MNKLCVFDLLMESPVEQIEQNKSEKRKQIERSLLFAFNSER